MKRKILTIEDIDVLAKHRVKSIDGHDIYLRGLSSQINLSTTIFRYIKLPYLLDMIYNKRFFIPNRNSFTDLRDKVGEEKYIEGISSPFHAVPSYRERLRIAQLWMREKMENETRIILCGRHISVTILFAG